VAIAVADRHLLLKAEGKRDVRRRVGCEPELAVEKKRDDLVGRRWRGRYGERIASFAEHSGIRRRKLNCLQNWKRPGANKSDILIAQHASRALNKR
jgi:hypothetical protein